MSDEGLVIFDCDGVLVESEAISRRVSYEMAAAELGFKPTPEEIEELDRRNLGRSDDDIFADLGTQLGTPVSIGFMVRLSIRKTEEYAKGVPAIPGAKGIVGRIAMAGLSRCVATSGTYPETEAKIEAAGLKGLFRERYYCAQMVLRGKPAPDLFLYAAQMEDVPPHGCVVIEDSAAGVQAAVAAGMRVLGYAPLGDIFGLADLGAEVFQSMSDVPGLLGI